MSKLRRGIFLMVGIVAIFTLLVSCSSASTPETESGPAGEVAESTTDDTNQEQPPTESGSQPAATEETNLNLSRLPDDIPVMPGARKLEVTQDGSNISYEVDGTIENVVTFYQEQLPDFGWEMTRSPDNVVGAMATMARVNENGDRLTFNLQYNPMGEFVVVRLVRLSSP